MLCSLGREALVPSVALYSAAASRLAGEVYQRQSQARAALPGIVMTSFRHPLIVDRLLKSRGASLSPLTLLTPTLTSHKTLPHHDHQAPRKYLDRGIWLGHLAP